MISASFFQSVKRKYCAASEQLSKNWLMPRALAGQQRALLLLVEIQCAQVEQNETKSQSPLTLIGKGRVYGIWNSWLHDAR